MSVKRGNDNEPSDFFKSMPASGRVCQSKKLQMKVLSWVVSVLLLLGACSTDSGTSRNPRTIDHAAEDCSGETDSITLAAFSHLISNYESLPPQFDDPVGREYCLALDRTLESEGTPAPDSILEEFSHNSSVHSLDWCQDNRGRVISVGPIDCTVSDVARVWSFSWVDSRPGGSDCLHQVTRTQAGWVVQQGCLEGLICN